MNAKHITSITIENFRGFGKLELDGLADVNLIVGQNNAGKTSLLEAIATVADFKLLRNLPGAFRQRVGDDERRFFRWLLKDGANESGGSISTKGDAFSTKIVIFRDPPKSLGPSFKHVYNLNQLQAFQEKDTPSLRVRISSAQGQNPQELVKQFGAAVRQREGEELMHKILQSVDSRILRVRVDPVEEGNIISVDMGLSESLPLTQAGEAVNRLVAILSDLIGDRPQICLIDEIEDGIHHTVLKQLWRGLGEISKRLGVQIFATTHSRECLEAANEVFVTEDDVGTKDFAVIQLMRVKGEVVGKVLNEARVNAALENEIELR